MSQYKNLQLKAQDRFCCLKLNTKNHNYRYTTTEDHEQISEPWDENDLLNNTLLNLKPWIMQQIALKNFDSVYTKLFSSNFKVNKEEFLDEIEKFSKSGQSFEELAEILKKLVDGKEKIGDFQNSAKEGNRRGHLNSRNTPAVEEGQRKILNIETKLEPIRPNLRADSSKFYIKMRIDEIFNFFSSDYFKKKRIKYAQNQQVQRSLSLEYFLYFCRCFRFFEFAHITADLLSNIFKKNSLYYKVMHKEHFISSLHDISKAIFKGSSRLNKLFEYMGLESGTYNASLIPKKDAFDYSSSEKQLNQTTQHRNLSRISDFNKNLAKLDEKKAPKTTGHNTRAPITWKMLNATDLSQLGEEYDVRKEIFPKFSGTKRLNSLY